MSLGCPETVGHHTPQNKNGKVGGVSIVRGERLIR